MFVVFSGPSCVGKTTTCRILIERLEVPARLIEADRYVPQLNRAASIASPGGSPHVALTLHRSIAAWDDEHQVIVVDGSLPFERADLIRPCLEMLGPATRTVALTCEPDELRRRLTSRRPTADIHRSLRQAGVLPDIVPGDLCVDTTHCTPTAVAETVATWLPT